MSYSYYILYFHVSANNLQKRIGEIMNIKFFVIVLVFMSNLFIVSIGQTEELAPGYDACVAKAISTADNIECLQVAYEHWDKILNLNYKNAMNACKSEENPKQCAADLKKAQTYWIQYKDAMDPVIKLLHGDGSLSRVLIMNFLVEETKKQAQILEPEG